MCRAGPSAHGRTSTALSAGAFPHDSADPPLVGPDRMCNTAPPPPCRPDAAHPGPAARPRHHGPAPALPHHRTAPDRSRDPSGEKGSMTLFPGRAGAGAHPTVTRRPPFPRRQRPRTATAGPQDRRSSPRGPGDADQDDAVGGGGLDRPRAGPVTPPNRDDGDCRRPRRSRPLTGSEQ